MQSRRVIGALVLAWLAVGPTSALARQAGSSVAKPGQAAARGRGRALGAPQIVDQATGSTIRIIARASGAMLTEFRGPGLDLDKVSHASGDFSVRIQGDHDVLSLVRAGDLLRVSRNGRSASVNLLDAGDDALEDVQHLLAGSRAARLFRTLLGRLSPETIQTPAAAGVDVVDALLGVLQGDAASVERRRQTTRAGGQMVMMMADGGTCYDNWESAVVYAWSDFVACCADVPLLSQACAFQWVLRVESAWFKFIACSSIPIKEE
jgi:hypothetical protein